LRGTCAKKYGFGIKAYWAERRDAFFDALMKAPAPIGEVHLFVHSFGGALVLGYQDRALGDQRDMIMAMYRGRPTPQQVVLNTEKGILFVHDLFRGPYAGLRDSLRRKFAPGAFLKIWGCNAGLEGHVYSDTHTISIDPLIIDYTTSPDFRIGDEFYWRALNSTRLPSIAQALASWLNIPVIAARSGAHIQASMHGRWTSAARLSRPIVERDDIRLHPDRGDYVQFKPLSR
jgi:hypothetical protein